MRDDKIKDLELKAERDLANMRSNNTMKRLEAEKNFEEVRDRLEKEKDKLNQQVADLTEKTEKEGGELESVLQEKQYLQ